MHHEFWKILLAAMQMVYGNIKYGTSIHYGTKPEQCACNFWNGCCSSLHFCSVWDSEVSSSLLLKCDKLACQIIHREQDTNQPCLFLLFLHPSISLHCSYKQDACPLFSRSYFFIGFHISWDENRNQQPFIYVGRKIWLNGKSTDFFFYLVYFSLSLINS